MIIMPDPYPRVPTDYDTAWSRLRKPVKAAIAAAALVPIVVVIAGFASGAADLGYVGFALAFAIWGPIGAYLGFVSDRLRERRRHEKPRFQPLENAELPDSQRRDALYQAQRRRMVEAVKQRRGD